MATPYRNDHDALVTRLTGLLDELAAIRSRTAALRDLERSAQDVEREIAAVRREVARVAPNRLPLLDRVSIAAPCPAVWDSMTGDDRTRCCSRCQKNVYNIAGMTTEAAEAFLREAGGEACLRLYRRADGTVLTSDCPVGVRRRRRRRAVASLVGGGLVAAGALQAVEVPFVHETLEVQHASFGDVGGNISIGCQMFVANIQVDLVDDQGRVVQSAVTNESGNYSFRNVDGAKYKVRVSRQGFRPAEAEVLPPRGLAPAGALNICLLRQ